MNQRIQVNPEIHFGKPCVIGTRITVRNVLELINEGLTYDEIRRDYYPDLKNEDIKACMDYAIALISAEEFNLAA
jgi:uncharacterized protein (DUF433 family)